MSDSGNGYANIYVETEIEEIKFDLTITYYSEGKKIAQTSSNGLENKLQKVFYNRGSAGVADKMEIEIIIYPPSSDYETKIFNHTWTR